MTVYGEVVPIIPPVLQARKRNQKEVAKARDYKLVGGAVIGCA
jgi:hypothetical protein